MNNFTVESTGDSVEIIITANLVTSAVEDLRGELKRQITGNKNKMTLNFKGIEMIDSMGIGLLISTHNALVERNIELNIINLSEDLFKLFKVMRLNEHLNLSPQ